jgi:UDP-glucose 4-epimerase
VQNDAQYCLPPIFARYLILITIKVSKLRCFVTGCAGFIGSALTERLLSDGHIVVGYDNFSTGQDRFLAVARESANFRLVRGDILDSATLTESMQGSEFVFHLAANADVRFGIEHPERDLQQNTIATHNVLNAMRQNGVGKIAFSSTASVYGETSVIPTPENAPFPIQTSLYGASKSACEGLIAAYCMGFGFQSYIFRFVSILGERYTHGHIFDFYRQLRENPGRLRVLGDGRQRKSYLYVHDCIDAMLLAVRQSNAIRQSNDRVNIFNLGTDEHCKVTDSIGWICEALGVTPTIEYSGGARGWVGDIPFIFLDTKKIRALGWMPAFTIRQSVISTLEYLRSNSWLLDVRR